ncbi:MAG: ferrochelatase [Bryobacteraceae bacterium]
MYDAVILVSFGGPEKREDVLPFLENVTRGRNVPRRRLLEVSRHYDRFGGKSPINSQCRSLAAALQAELRARGMNLPVYWGNRNWHPLLAGTLREMRAAGVERALAFVTSAYSSYSSCRQYREDIEAARTGVGEGAPCVDKLRVFYNHPRFIEASAQRVREALAVFPQEEREQVRFVVTAHSIPSSMAETSHYEKQLRETARLAAAAAGFHQWDLAFQSRSGPPAQPWLGPGILEHLKALRARGASSVLIAPLGFISDHLEVLYDLDIEAAALAADLGMKMVRAQTVGTHPEFVRMICELIEERISDAPRRAAGVFGVSPDVCAADCCPRPRPAGILRASEAPAVSQLL